MHYAPAYYWCWAKPLRMNTASDLPTPSTDHPANKANKAMPMAQQGRLNDTLALVEHALVQSPNYPDLLLLQGGLLSGLKRAPEAIAAYNMATEVEPVNVRALMASANL